MGRQACRYKKDASTANLRFLASRKMNHSLAGRGDRIVIPMGKVGVLGIRGDIATSSSSSYSSLNCMIVHDYAEYDLFFCTHTDRVGDSRAVMSGMLCRVTAENSSA